MDDAVTNVKELPETLPYIVSFAHGVMKKLVYRCAISYLPASTTSGSMFEDNISNTWYRTKDSPAYIKAAQLC
jgi:hypothetical protein